MNGESVNRYVEIESGGNKDKISINKNVTIEDLLMKRSVLLQTIKEVKFAGATIVVKEASRLSLLID